MITVINFQYLKEKTAFIYRADGPHLSRGASRLLHFASLFPLLSRRCSNPPKNLESGSDGAFLPVGFYSLKRYTCRAMCAGGCDEIMEKYGVGNFIVAFAEWGALPGLAASKGR
ncbi:hypothetical protein MU978_005776 [Salmonella enterica]|nr:hypothetical protein [Salmonella enterica]EJA5989294.1 hypothetical protein [Salmonella enterica]